MTQRLWVLAFAVGLAFSCREPGPRVGGETNWLTLCNKDADCSTGSCLCGVCTDPCNDAPCPDDALCADSTSDAWDQLCSSHQDPPLCVPRCVGETCPAGLVCRDGGCVPEAAAARRLPAFPGAEGFGARSRGGRGGRVVKVTTLDATGPGSLAEALALNEPRTIVFAVSGVIDAPLIEIPFGNVTIAGQTAPGAGITLRGRLQGAFDENFGHVILRYLRVRPEYDGSDVTQFDAIQFGRGHHLMLDHVSVAFGVDETIDVFESSDVTIQWCTIETPNDADNPNDRFIRGIVAGPNATRLSVHHLFCAHSLGACVSLAAGPAELVSSHFFDVRAGFSHSDLASGPFRLISNTFLSGPNSTLLPLLFDDERAEPDPTLAYYIANNTLANATTDCPAGNVDDPWSLCTYTQGGDPSLRVTEDPNFDAFSAEYVPITVTLSDAVTETVLTRSGSLPHDVVTRTAVADARAGTGVIDGTVPADLLEGLTPAVAPPDGDDDGMADQWELDHGLDPTDPFDHSRTMPSGYSALEEYLDQLATGVVP